MSPSLFVPGIVLLGIVIFVHELGHFLVAKWRGVRVLRFSLGFGPAMVRFEHGGTEYRIAWVPLGGYVQMAGDAPGEDGTMPGGPDEFLSHPWYGRLMIAIAGPMANLVTAFVVMVATCLIGVKSPDYDTVSEFVPDSSAAFSAGLRSGDRIAKVGETPVQRWSELETAVGKRGEHEAVRLVIDRGGQPVTLEIGPEQRARALSSMFATTIPPVVGGVVTGMPAYKAGLKEGDRILAIDGKPMQVWSDLLQALRGHVDQNVVVTVDREGRRFDLPVKPINPEGRRGSKDARIGIEPQSQGSYLLGRYPPLEAIKVGAGATVSMVANVYGGMWLTITRPIYYREYLGGPIFIAQAASESARRGFDSYLQFLALINVAIMAFNLLPIPVLDGGHILLALFQAVRGQAISARAYVRFQKVGLVFIGTLFVLILANDPLRWVQRQRALDKAPQGGQVAPSPP